MSFKCLTCFNSYYVFYDHKFKLYVLYCNTSLLALSALHINLFK